MRESLIALILLLPLPIFAASNEETLQYIIADYQDQCEKAQEDFRDIDYKEGDPVVAELKLSEDNIYEITIDIHRRRVTAQALAVLFRAHNLSARLHQHVALLDTALLRSAVEIGSPNPLRASKSAEQSSCLSTSIIASQTASVRVSESTKRQF